MKAEWRTFYADLTKFLKDVGDVLAQIYHDPHESKTQVMNQEIDKREMLYSMAKSFLGSDASPRDYAPDDLGCAESLSSVIRRAFPEMNFPILLSTKELYEYFERSTSFTPIVEPEFGCIMLAVTSSGNGKISNGHVAIVGKYKSPDGTLWAMSNDSRTGTFEVNFTIDSFTRYYNGKGGMPILFYRIT